MTSFVLVTDVQESLGSIPDIGKEVFFLRHITLFISKYKVIFKNLE